ncbi:MAG TPA: RNA polymerase sigma factor [Deltaproteobacteria bacterium]|nr:RNA polymerase sigma factor [Deltaproteobacteria bacterium]
MRREARDVPSTQTLLDERIARHRREILAFLRRRAPADAEEIAQETWMRVARSNPDCPDEASFRAYAYTVARRLLIDHHRHRARSVTLVPLEGGAEPMDRSDPLGAVVAGQALALVQAELEVMKPELAEVFRLRMTTGLSFKEIAARQGCSLNTALGRHHQATRRLARALSARGLRGGSRGLRGGSGGSGGSDAV